MLRGNDTFITCIYSTVRYVQYIYKRKGIACLFPIVRPYSHILHRVCTDDCNSMMQLQIFFTFLTIYNNFGTFVPKASLFPRATDPKSESFAITYPLQGCVPRPPFLTSNYSFCTRGGIRSLNISVQIPTYDTLLPASSCALYINIFE